VYRDLSEIDYRAALEAMSLPGPFAHILADSSAKSAAGALFDDSHTLSGLIGRPQGADCETEPIGNGNQRS